MLFLETPLPGVFVIEPERRVDPRGFFARLWCRKEFEARSLVSDFPQANLSVNAHAGTLRGLHFQNSPHEEVKIVRCIKGALFDVAVDLRPSSPTYRRWYGVELTGDSYRALYVPQGFGHGFQTLADDTEAEYMVSAYYAPGSEGGVRYDDAAIGIDWPMPVTQISDKDRAWPPMKV